MIRELVNFILFLLLTRVRRLLYSPPLIDGICRGCAYFYINAEKSIDFLSLYFISYN